MPYLGGAFDISQVLLALNDCKDEDTIEQMLCLTSLPTYALFTVQHAEVVTKIQRIAMCALSLTDLNN